MDKFINYLAPVIAFAGGMWISSLAMIHSDWKIIAAGFVLGISGVMYGAT